jgi:dephospho-CoA kinase
MSARKKNPARKYNKICIIGLTGSIGMGKTTLAKQFEQCGVPVCDSDAIVHRLLGAGGAAVSRVAQAFPESLQGNHINREILAGLVFNNEPRLKMLESILHPMIKTAQDRFIRRAQTEARSMIVLDIPLLFETGGEKKCDVTVVATAPYFVQRARVLKRPRMSEEKFARILKLQMPDAEKRKKADFVVQTGQGKYVSLKAVRRIVRELQINKTSV